MYDIVTITVNYKMKDDIDRMLQGLLLDVNGSQLNVLTVVVDNDSRDNIAGLLHEKYPQVSFIAASTNIGFGRANNLALRRYEAKYYFILNPDITFLPGAHVIGDLYKYMEANAKIGMIGPKLLNTDGSVQESCYRFPEFLTQPLRRLSIGQKWLSAQNRIKKFLMEDFDHLTERPVDWIMGSAMFVRGEAVREVGLFDDRYFLYFEDCDWCRRFWDVGWPVYYVPQIILTHTHQRLSAKVEGKPAGLKAIFTNKVTRIHLQSWLKYFWKWRGRTI